MCILYQTFFSLKMTMLIGFKATVCQSWVANVVGTSCNHSCKNITLFLMHNVKKWSRSAYPKASWEVYKKPFL